MTTVLETCRISPPLEAAAELTVPLSFFDILWLHVPPMSQILFYDHPYSKADFLDILVPKLKQSISLTLKHYLPLAGNLLYPLHTDEKKPVFRYVAGDSLSLSIAESSDDFDDLVGNHARDADCFYDFVQHLPPVTEEAECKKVPLLALQVTLFPNRGLCLSLATLHCLSDVRPMVEFMLAWASINKFGGDEELLDKNAESLPNFDRSLVQDTNGIDTKFWKIMSQTPFDTSLSFPLPTNRVRATYILRPADIKKLKDLVLAEKPSLVQVSSFVVTASYIWSCLVKSGDAAGEEAEANESEIFFFPVDARGRLNALINPPVPGNYFGNCLGGGVANIEHEKLVGEEGFVIAAEAITQVIKNKVNNKDEFLADSENWASYMQKSPGGARVVGVSGSPKFDFSDADFGWGEVRKAENLSIDAEKYSMSVCKSRDSDGGLEVGLSLPRERMEAFAAIFADGLKP